MRRKDKLMIGIIMISSNKNRINERNQDRKEAKENRIPKEGDKKKQLITRMRKTMKDNEEKKRENKRCG